MKECIISVLVPLYNEAENLKPLFQRINESLSEFGRDFEVIFVNDGSSDDSEELLVEIQRSHDNVTVINFFKNMGKAVALEQGFEIANGRYVVIIDSDLQHDPEDIPLLIKKMDEGFDVVSGKRINRQDSNGKIITSRIFNIIVRLIAGLRLDDYFSGLKCFNAGVINFLALYGDLYRFAEVFAFRRGFRVTEIPVAHHHRAHGSSKYSPMGRLRRAINDLIVLLFTITFSRRRAYRVGMAGFLALGVGVTLLFISICILVFGKGSINPACATAGLLMSFIGIQALLVKKIADNFIAHHHREYAYRKRNIRSILRPEIDR